MIARITWPAGGIPKIRLEHAVAWEEE